MKKERSLFTYNFENGLIYSPSTFETFWIIEEYCISQKQGVRNVDVICFISSCSHRARGDRTIDCSLWCLFKERVSAQENRALNNWDWFTPARNHVLLTNLQHLCEKSGLLRVSFLFQYGRWRCYFRSSTSKGRIQKQTEYSSHSVFISRRGERLVDLCEEG